MHHLYDIVDDAVVRRRRVARAMRRRRVALDDPARAGAETGARAAMEGAARDDDVREIHEVHELNEIATPTPTPTTETTTETTMETTMETATATDDAAADEARMRADGTRAAADAASSGVVRPGTIVRAPAPPLPPETWAVRPVDSSATVGGATRRRGGMGREARRRLADARKWAAARDDARDDGKTSREHMEAKKAREIEAWRSTRAREGVDGSTNPNFVPVGDWRAKVAAARREAKLEEFRALRARETATATASRVEHEGETRVKSTEDATLPSGWRAFVDEGSGEVFYGHVDTKQTQWARPSC